MSDRPTPETDIEHLQFAMGGFTLDFCRKLERERDEVREKAERYRIEANAMMMQRDEARSLTEHQWLLKVGSRLFVAGCKSDGIIDSLDEIIRERDEAREVLREIAEASGFDNIGNWARNKARKEIDRYREKNDLLPISWDV